MKGRQAAWSWTHIKVGRKSGERGALIERGGSINSLEFFFFHGHREDSLSSGPQRSVFTSPLASSQSRIESEFQEEEQDDDDDERNAQNERIHFTKQQCHPNQRITITIPFSLFSTRTECTYIWSIAVLSFLLPAGIANTINWTSRDRFLEKEKRKEDPPRNRN